MAEDFVSRSRYGSSFFLVMICYTLSHAHFEQSMGSRPIGALETLHTLAHLPSVQEYAHVARSLSDWPHRMIDRARSRSSTRTDLIADVRCVDDGAAEDLPTDGDIYQGHRGAVRLFRSSSSYSLNSKPFVRGGPRRSPSK